MAAVKAFVPVAFAVGTGGTVMHPSDAVRGLEGLVPQEPDRDLLT
jgi:hypothetical protein